MMKQLIRNTSSWLWIPTLYFAEGIPYFIVNNISVTMFTRMGVPNGEMALFTSLLYLPWTIKPLWSPFVDILRTKRWWILAMQVLISIIFILLTLSIPHPSAHLIDANACEFVYIHVDTLFHYSLCLGNARYRGRRLLYAGLESSATIVLCRYSQHVLPPFVYLRTRSLSADSGSFRDTYRQYTVSLDTDDGFCSSDFHPHQYLSRFLYTSTGGGFCATWCNKCTRPGYYLRVRAHLCNLFSEAWCGYCGCLYVALSTARSLSLENGQSFFAGCESTRRT